MRSVFILVPQLVPTGPIKGAIALANAMVRTRKVTLVSLRLGSGADAAVDPRVVCYCLGSEGHNFVQKLKAYQLLLRKAGGRSQTASISMCFSADVLNRFCRRDAVIVSSVRGNLPMNYRMDYGWLGALLATIHLLSLRSFDHVVAMSKSMVAQIESYTGLSPSVIGNFVDEVRLEPFRCVRKTDSLLRFVFLASLSSRKQPFMLLDAMSVLKRDGHAVWLDIVGKGPLADSCHQYVEQLKLQDVVCFHGHLSSPYSLLAAADALVVPSLSEGISRASLEALYLGVPCVLRDVDGNAEFIHPGVNGALFSGATDFPAAMLIAAGIARKLDLRPNLLPPEFRQESCALRYLELVESMR